MPRSTTTKADPNPDIRLAAPIMAAPASSSSIPPFTKRDVQEMAKTVMLAKPFEPAKHDPVGWWESEKCDGVRALAGARSFFSRQGNEFYAPEWFSADLPKQYMLDGELWLGLGRFSETVSIVKKQKQTPEQAERWKNIQFLVFDVVMPGVAFEDRLKWLTTHLQGCKYARVLPQNKCTSRAELADSADKIIAGGGEGIMLKAPGSMYEHKRSNLLLKVKKFYDMEAQITSIETGKGRNAHRMGAIGCVLPNGVTFRCGSGFDDATRDHPPKIGSVVSVQYAELDKRSGRPRFPTFLRVRTDVSWGDIVRQARADASVTITAAPSSSVDTAVSISATAGRSNTKSKRSASVIKYDTSSDESDDDEDGNSDKDDDDEEEEEEEEVDKAGFSNNTRAKPACKYGITCYRQNPHHLANFSHPRA